MPRLACLDAPGVFHHIIIWGIERRKIFRDNREREDFLDRLGKLLLETKTGCYAWAFLPNHAHFLLRTGEVPLATLMRRLLTGYVVSFNRRHKRYGHLMQNRYLRASLYALIMLLFISAPSPSFADEIITGHYCYTYGDNESLKEARETTRMLAIRNAIESYRTFITSASTVRNFQLTDDLIQIISSGYLKDLRTIEHKEEGRTICETIQASVSPQAIENIIKTEVRKRTKDIEEAGIDSDEYLKIISVKTGETEDGKIRYITALIKMLKYCSEHYPCYIYVTFFNSEGNPVGGDRHAIYGFHRGEIRSVYICALPSDAKSYKVWLKER